MHKQGIIRHARRSLHASPSRQGHFPRTFCLRVMLAEWHPHVEAVGCVSSTLLPGLMESIERSSPVCADVLKQDCPESCIVGRSLRYIPVGERVGRESRADSGLRASSAGARLCHDRLAPTRSIGTRRFIKPFLSASAIASTPVSPFLSSFSCCLPLVHPVCLSSQTAFFTP